MTVHTRICPIKTHKREAAVLLFSGLWWYLFLCIVCVRMCVCLSVSVYVCVCVCVHMGVPVQIAIEARSQPWLSLLSCHLPCSFEIRTLIGLELSE